jgi:hypothetical protein
MLEADYETSKSLPEAEDLHYLELGLVKGMYWRTSQENQISANWATYRHYRSQPQLVRLSLRGERKDSELLMKILRAIKVEQD